MIASNDNSASKKNTGMHLTERKIQELSPNIKILDEE